MEHNSAFYIVIPAPIWNRKDLTDKEMRLYGTISALANQKGFCFASNEALGEMLNTSGRTIRRYVSHMADLGIISTKIIYEDDGKTVKERHISILDKDALPLRTQVSAPPDSTVRTPADTGVHNNITSNINNIPPISPKGDAGELFDLFWQNYPRKKGKDAARKAFKKLNPDRETVLRWNQLINRNLEEVKRQHSRRGEDYLTFMPWASTWLNQKRWEDEPDHQPESDDEEEVVWI